MILVLSNAYIYLYINKTMCHQFTTNLTFAWLFGNRFISLRSSNPSIGWRWSRESPIAPKIIIICCKLCFKPDTLSWWYLPHAVTFVCKLHIFEFHPPVGAQVEKACESTSKYTNQCVKLCDDTHSMSYVNRSLSDSTVMYFHSKSFIWIWPDGCLWNGNASKNLENGPDSKAVQRDSCERQIKNFIFDKHTISKGIYGTWESDFRFVYITCNKCYNFFCRWKTVRGCDQTSWSMFKRWFQLQAVEEGICTSTWLLRWVQRLPY